MELDVGYAVKHNDLISKYQGQEGQEGQESFILNLIVSRAPGEPEHVIFAKNSR